MPVWDDKALTDLLVALYTGVQGEITREQQDRVVDAMRAKGYDDVHWDKIRYRPLLYSQPPISRSFLLHPPALDLAFPYPAGHKTLLLPSTINISVSIINFLHTHHADL
jgi:hypothetical protein